MAANTSLFDVKVTGLVELNRTLRELPLKLRKKALTKALRAAGKVVLAEARAKAPVLSSAKAAKTPYRKSGTVKRALAVRVSKKSAREGNVGVFINVRPAAGDKYQVIRNQTLGVKYKTKRLKTASKRGKKSPVDPYYWRWLEFGTAKMAARPFIKPASEKLEEARREFEKSAIKAIAELNKKV